MRSHPTNEVAVQAWTGLLSHLQSICPTAHNDQARAGVGVWSGAWWIWIWGVGLIKVASLGLIERADGPRLAHVDTIQELSNILVLDQSRLVDLCG
jgi:hypothetical protein